MPRPGVTDQLSIRQDDWKAVPERDYERVMAIREEAFPPAERSAEDTVARRSSTWLWIARSGAEVVGFASGLRLESSRAAYLEYLAVDKSLRGLGAGTAVLAAILRDLRTDGTVRGVALEVEDPVRTPGNDPVFARRVAFYARWGAHAVRFLSDYSMPDLASPGDRVPMLVLWRPLADGDELGPADLTLLLTDLYRGYYAHAAPEGHLAEMIARIE